MKKENSRHRQVGIFRYCEPINSNTKGMFRTTDHVLGSVISGELIKHGEEHDCHIKAGQYFFIRRDTKLMMEYHAAAKESSCKMISIHLQPTALRTFWRAHEEEIRKEKELERIQESAIILDSSVALDALFSSLLVYFKSGENIPAWWLAMKEQEAIHALLTIDNSFYPTLFDFTSQWKIDLAGFMEDHYREELSMADLALLSGRSAATFKREFAKNFDKTPQQWIINRRLEEAHRLITEKHSTPIEAYIHAGFKNRTHFYKVYKKKFGQTPGKV